MRELAKNVNKDNRIKLNKILDYIIPFSNINALMRRVFSALSLSHSVGVDCDYAFFSRL